MCAQSSMAYEQRSRNRQPLGRFNGLGTTPGSVLAEDASGVLEHAVRRNETMIAATTAWLDAYIPCSSLLGYRWIVQFDRETHWRRQCRELRRRLDPNRVHRLG